MHDAATGSRRSATRPIRRRVLGLTLALGAIATGLVAPAAASAATTPTTLTDGTGSTCTGHWPASVQGMPAYHAGGAAGDYIWHDSTGWHLRVTHASSTGFTFSGTIRSNKPLHVQGFKLETGDTFTLSADKLTLTYRFRNYGHTDGLNFTTECATRLGISGRMNGSLLPVRRLWLGAHGVHPLQNPFAIYRRA